MNKNKVNTQPKSDRSDISVCLEKFKGMTTVAAPDGESANETRFERTYPKHGTQAARLLAALLNTEEFTQVSALEGLAIARLPAVVQQLTRKFGWRIDKTSTRVVNRFGEATNFALYKLCIDDIELAGLNRYIYSETEFELMEWLEEKACRARRRG